MNQVTYLYTIFSCDHSLGAALAVLNAVDIAGNLFNTPQGQPSNRCLVTVFAFGCPRVGDANFLKVFQSLKNLRVLKIRNALDIVTLYPFVGYCHYIGVSQIHVYILAFPKNS